MDTLSPDAAAAVRPTKKQRVLLDYIQAFITQHGYSPSYREIMNGCGYNSIATVAVHINNLISRGHLRKRDHSARSLELTGFAVSAEALWVLAKLEALVTQLEQTDVVRTEAQQRQVLADVHTLVAALPVLEIAMPEALGNRLQALMP